MQLWRLAVRYDPYSWHYASKGYRYFVGKRNGFLWAAV